jgi:hypothetical protein
MTSNLSETKKPQSIEDSKVGYREYFVQSVNPGLGLATVPGLGLYKEILDYYNQIHFHKNNDGSYDTVVDHTTNILKKHGFKGNGSIEKVEDIYIYPSEYFCPMNYMTGKIQFIGILQAGSRDIVN